MNAKVENSEFRLDWLKWALIIALVAAGVVGNAYFADQSLLYRVLGLVALAAVALLLVVNTAKGSAVWSLMREAQTEIRKVVWPTKQESMQTTLIVVVAVLLMALILWGLDSLFGWVASLIIG